jgi:hypothetical protein
MVSDLIAVVAAVIALVALMRTRKTNEKTGRIQETQLEIQTDLASLQKKLGSYELQEYEAPHRLLPAVARRLSHLIAALPERVSEREIRQFVLWSENDLHELDRLASIVGEDALELASNAVSALRFLGAIIAHVQSVNPGLGYDNRHNRKRDEQWPNMVTNARDYLFRLTVMGEELKP